MYTNQWRRSRDFYEINPESISGGKLNIYRHVKNTLATKGYILNVMQSVWGRRVLAGLRIGWLSLAVTTGRCSKTPYCERVCRLCDRREVEDQLYVYVYAQQLLICKSCHCNSLSTTLFTYTAIKRQSLIHFK